MMTDLYDRPKTVAKCHERIDTVLHTNRVQADTINELRQKLKICELEKIKIEAELQYSRQSKVELNGLKAMLSMLGRSDNAEGPNT